MQAVELENKEGQICLTPLGFHLASLPVDPHLGKMLLLGCVCQCLDPVLTIVAAMSCKCALTTRSPSG